jgi:hypothetical protein
MRRLLTIATLFLLCTSAAVSQSRSHGGSFSGRSFGGRHFSGGGHFGSPRFAGGHFRGGGHFHGGTRVFVGGSFGFGHNRFGVSFGHGFHHRHFSPRFGFAFYGASYYPYGYYPYYPPYYPYYGYDPYYAYPRPAYPIAYQSTAAYDRSDDNLAREVDRLRDEVDRLRDERSGGYERERVPQPPPRSQAGPKPLANQPSTVLVFRSGNREETSNYAIAGQTLWIFSEQRARKVPLSDLDIDATRAVNEERGVEFNSGRR